MFLWLAIGEINKEIAIVHMTRNFCKLRHRFYMFYVIILAIGEVNFR